MAKKQTKKYGVYYIGAPYGIDEMGELCYQSANYDRCIAYIGKHDYRLHGSNSIIRDISGQRVER